MASDNELLIKLGVESSSASKQIKEITKELKTLDKEMNSVDKSVDGFNQMDILEGFLIKDHHLAAQLPHFLIVMSHHFDYITTHQQCDRSAEQGKDRQGSIIVKNHAQSAGELQKPGQKLRKPTQHTGRNGGNISRYTGQNIS